jgi:hypothetical protein
VFVHPAVANGDLVLVGVEPVDSDARGWAARMVRTALTRFWSHVVE